MDLSSVHTLFESHEDAYRGAGDQNAVNFSVYPLAFTRSLGNVQADGLIAPFSRRLDILDEYIRQRINEQNDPTHMRSGRGAHGYSHGHLNHHKKNQCISLKR